MNVFLLAAKNLIAKKTRTLLTAGGVGIAVAVLVALLAFDAGYQRALKNDIERMGYQVLVTAKGCPYEAATLMLKGGGGLRYMDAAVYKKIVDDPRIAQITPQFVATLYDPDRREGQGGMAMYMGISRSFLDLKPWVKFASGGWFSAEKADEAILGYEAAELEQRQPGDRIFVPEKNRVLTVTGILERTGTQDDGVIFLPLKTAQEIFGHENELTGIGVKLKEVRQLAAFEEDLYDEPGIQVVSMAQVKGTIFNLISSAQTMTRSVALMAVIIAIIGVINTILMSVFERTREIGVMKAIGASRMQIFALVSAETLLIAFAGGVLGNLMAFLGGNLIEAALKSFLPYAPSGRLVLLSPALCAGALFGAVAIGLLASVYPSFRASSLRPIEAIRRGE